MKRTLILIAICMASLSQQLSAQVNVNVQIGRRPAWGPPGDANYYYFPNYSMYYNVPQGTYVYYNGGRWITTRTLPYRNANLYSTRKVIVNDRDPWGNHSYYVRRYGGQNHGYSGYRRPYKYQNGHGPGQGQGYGHGHGRGDGHGHGHGHGHKDRD